MSLGGVLGAVVGAFIGGPMGALQGYSVGSAIDSAINPQTITGPRLDDLRIQMSTYGAPIPFEWGINRHAGTIIWPETLVAVEHEDRTSSKGGPDTVKFRYTLSCAVLICEGPIAGIRRIWANKKIVYDVSAGNSGATQDPHVSGLRFHLGTETQQVDPLIEARDGPSPAYLGYAYVVFEDYDVTDMNGRPPQWEFEVITTGTAIPPRAPVYLGESATANPSYLPLNAMVDKTTGLIYSLHPWGVLSSILVRVNSDVTQTQTASHLINIAATGTGCCGSVASESILNRARLFQTPYGIWIAGSGTVDQLQVFYKISADGLVVSGPFDAWHIQTCFCPPLFDIPIPTRHSTRHGTAVINEVFYNPIDDRVVLLRYGGGVTFVNPQDAFKTIGVPFNIGEGFGSLGLIQITRVIVTPVYFAAFYQGSSIGVILRRLDDYSFYAQFSCQQVELGQGSCFYDPDRDRLIVNHNSGASPFNYQIIDIATATMTSHTFVAATGADTIPAPSRAIVSAAYQGGKYLFGARAGGGVTPVGTTLYIINAETLATDFTYTYEAHDPSVPYLMLDPLLSPSDTSKPYIFSFDQFRVKRLYMDGRLSPSRVPLSLIVSDICMRGGLLADDIDVTQLTDLVDGYIVPRQTTGRAAIEPLQSAYYFDAVESDSKIKFVKRGTVPAVTMLKNDRAAHAYGETMPDALTIVRGFELELPVQCDVSYSDVDADHLVGNQYDRRIGKDTRHKISLQLPIVMTATKAKEIARVTLYQAWLNHTYRWTTTRKYAKYEPTDVVILPTDDVSYSAIITAKREHPNGIIEWEGRMTALEVYAQNGEDASSIDHPTQTIVSADATILALLDIPMLRDDDNDAGFYAAMGGAI